MNASSDYQKLRAHLAFLRITAAAGALPAELIHASKASLTHAAFLERILAVEAAAADERRRSAWSGSRRCRPRSPSPTSTSPPSRPSTRS